MQKKVIVIGAGVWGTALGLVAHRGGSCVTLWTPDVAVVEKITTQHKHPALPGIAIPENIYATDVVKSLDVDLVIFAVPTQFVRSALEKWRPYLSKNTPLLMVAKGIEINTGHFINEIVDNIAPTAILSGPNFAIEVAQGKPSATTIACDDFLWPLISDIMSTDTFRPYQSHDKIGVQLGGALKNVVAVACGFTRGLNLGENAQAALITRALHEIQQLGIAMGADAKTFDGLSGMGDLMLTCFGSLSRNMQFGTAWVSTPDHEVLLKKFGTVEGVHTAKSVKRLADTYKVEMPICSSVFDILYDEKSPLDAMKELFGRPLKHEQHDANFNT